VPQAKSCPPASRNSRACPLTSNLATLTTPELAFAVQVFRPGAGGERGTAGAQPVAVQRSRRYGR
jgi:hypothetical protein